MKAIKNLIAVAALSTFASFSSVAMANGQCLDNNTVTCITEEQINYFGDPAIEYTIENNADERLFGFGVSNSIAFNSAEVGRKPEPVLISNFANANTFNIGWNALYIDRWAWDHQGLQFNFWDASQNDLSMNMAPPSKTWITGTAETYFQYQLGDISPQGPEPVFLGSFDSRFGTEDNGVAFYWNAFENDTPLNNGVTLDNFFLTSQPNTQFSTFGGQGNVVTTSVAAIPEPETYAMFLAGLGLMTFVARKKQA